MSNDELSKNERIKIYNDFCIKAVNNPGIPKKEVCNKFGFNETQNYLILENCIN